MNEFLKRHAPAKARRARQKTFVLKVRNKLTCQVFTVGYFLRPGDLATAVHLFNRTQTDYLEYFSETS